MKSVPFTFQTKLFLYLSLAFMAFAVIGTLSHEGGHYIAARYYGYEAKINYAMTSYGNKANNTNKELLAIWQRNQYAIENKLPFSEQTKLDSLKSVAKREHIIMTLGGPLQTMLTGTIGFLLLLVYRKQYEGKPALTVKQWFFVLLSLFWMRQLFNLISGLLSSPATGITGIHSDEVKLALTFGWPAMVLYYITGGIAAILLVIILFKFIPLQQRLTFITASIVGGVGGSIFWLYSIGPMLMP